MHNLLGITALTTGARDRTCYLTENSNFEIHGPFPKQDQSWTSAIVDHATIRDLLTSGVSPAIDLSFLRSCEIYLKSLTLEDRNIAFCIFSLTIWNMISFVCY